MPVPDAGTNGARRPTSGVVDAIIAVLIDLGAAHAQVVRLVADAPTHSWQRGDGDPREAALAGARAAATGQHTASGAAFATPIVVDGDPWGALSISVPSPEVRHAAVAALPGLAGALAAHVVETREHRDAVRRSRLILDSIADGVYGVDPDGRATFVNPAASAMLGWQPHELIGRVTHPLVHHSHADGTPYPREDCSTVAALREGIVRHVDDELFWRSDGSSFPVAYTTTPMREGERVVGAVVTFRDITDQRRAHRQARTDVLTGLPNLRAFREAVDLAIPKTAAAPPLTLVLFDLDRFKAVNDAHGHPVGDEVLMATGAALRSVAREGDAIARLGGEEFAWLLPGLSVADALPAVERARRAVAELRHPDAGSITVSAGVAGLQSDDPDGGRLFRDADAALYRAKRSGRNRVCFSSGG